METKRNRKISLKEILEDIDPSEIESFVLQYAKNEKAFEIALKAHFVSRLITDDTDQKYQRILAEIIKPKTIAKPKLSQTVKKSVNVVFEDFTFQMADLLSIEDYKEAFYIIRNSLDKIAYLQNRYLMRDKSIEKFRLEFLHGLKIILDQNLAPTFRSIIEALLLENVRKSYFYPKRENLASVLDDYSVLTESDKTELVADLLEKKDFYPDQHTLIMALIQLSVPLGHLANKLTIEIEHNKIFKALTEFISLRKFELVEFYISNKEVHYNLNIPALNCMLYHERENYTKLSKNLVKLTASSTSILNLKDVVEHLSPSYLRQEFDEISEWIRELPFGLKSYLYSKTGKIDLLLEALEEQKELEWLKVYDKSLIEQGKRNEVKDLYLNYAIDHLENHVGRKAHEYVSRINHRLVSLSENKMLTEIQEKLYDRFSDRSSSSES